MQVACLHRKRWIMYYMCHSVPFFLVSERSGRKPPATRSIARFRYAKRLVRTTLFSNNDNDSRRRKVK